MRELSICVLTILDSWVREVHIRQPGIFPIQHQGLAR